MTIDTLLEVPDAVARILADVRPLSTARVPLLEAYGLVLARDAVASVTLPPWNNSAMDGYAVQRSDLASLPTVLRVTETVPAGGFPTRAVERGTATRIMTGAPVPDGADTVVRVEDTDGGTSQVEIRSDRDAGKNIRPRGEDIIEGRAAIPAGTALGAAQIGVLAPLGCGGVEVHRVTLVAIAPAGGEAAEVERVG